MTATRQVGRNIVMSIIQVIVTGVSVFLLYRFVIDSIGIAAFGIWALVLAMTSASSVANLGIAGSAVKFVSQYLAIGDVSHVEKIVETTVLFVTIFLVVVAIALFPLFEQILSFAVEPPDQLPAALSVLPYALASFCLSSTSAVVLSCVDGYHRVDLRGLVLALGSVLYLGLAIGLVPGGGLIGLAQAQVIQAGILVLASWLILKRLEPRLPWLPHRFNWSVFKEIFSYSAQFQVISISKVLFEPTTKLLVSKFGGAVTVGYFEFAYRMVFQLRSIIITGHSALVPTIADIHVRAPQQLRQLYRQSFAVLTFAIIVSLPFLLGITPVVSSLWIGSLEPTFVLFAVLLYLGWFSNIFSAPAYFANLGTGDLRWNIYGHLLTGLVNAVFGVLLGVLLGVNGVVLAFMVGTMAGGAVLIVHYQRKHGIAASDLIDSETILLAAFALSGMVAVILINRYLGASLHVLLMFGVSVICYAAIIWWPAWRHPVRKQVAVWSRSLRSDANTEQH